MNEDTGVYFSFDINEGEFDAETGDSPVSLNINYYRPSYFALEAAPEVASFVKEFDLTIIDPQVDGMGEGEFDVAAFIAGWNKGNEFGYQAILSGEGATPDKVLSQPAAPQREVWRWNHHKAELQETLGPDVFVPRIAYMMIDGVLSTVSVWPDAIPIACQPVDCLLVGRERFAPKRFFMRKKDMVALPWNEAAPWLEKYRSSTHSNCIVLDYLAAPADLAAFIESLPSRTPDVELVRNDKVLDREMIAAALGKPGGRRNDLG